MKLVKFLMKLNNEKVQVELKNGTVISGEIVSVTPSMNINLKNVKMTIKHRNPISLEYINIRGNQVRLVILPDELNIDSILSDSMLRPKNLSTVAPVQKAQAPIRGGRRGRGRARAF
ncbi:hypothetical protein KL930_000260 [Ogataea haglerorum]|uniref:Small nuclear ribonucleoprotein Sm D1 n=1 Tax=Ogataea haglerorum TaxID=1937702 RepID=A0AAN6D4X3_9ASCO|nr:uncharacterized protein KL911_000871 [Ogataea haglerorum]KAG7697685.1 hypothetical protein KL951_002259 [Ogataea haglerorum]KAG7701286.1 hypothetical protein KL915_000317 [Ogataea haglerorum]KAG7706505.1 hypothetical protein KL950_003170 [Ogataea haglerorum]KAG7709244.1 hypothetical protein KL914_001634 [Ogataea haglerorum]KAG7717892.1 hypothetical protein KL913_002828 [Ogataea haglerorum]